MFAQDPKNISIKVVLIAGEMGIEMDPRLQIANSVNTNILLSAILNFGIKLVIQL